jgi:cell division protein FtsW
MRVAVTLLTFCVAALLALGMVMLYSSSMTQVGAHYLVRQLVWCVIGLFCCVVATWADYRWLKKMAWPMFGLAVCLLILVLIPHIGSTDIGHKANGARRWFVFRGMSFQPSELAKIALIIALAWYGERFQRQMPGWKRGIVTPAIFCGVVLLLILKEPDFGTTILLATVSGVMLLVAGARWSYIVPPVAVAIAALALIIWHDPMRSGRVYSWMHLEETKQDQGHQAYQAQLAFGAGGWTGLGLGNGRQKTGFVPEHHTDFILSIIGEELGLVSTLLVIAGFVTIGICGIYIALHSADAFGMLLATGLTSLIVLQALINIAVVTGAVPNKGLPLPFISYGGSNLMMMLASVGVLFSIARHSRVPERKAVALTEASDEIPAAHAA